MKYETRFHCPKCSGFRYGSAQIDSGVAWRRHCNGHVHMMDHKDGQIRLALCGFTWHEKDDYKFFIQVGSFESDKEFEKRKNTP
jgi:hypothetical protein